MTDRRLTYHKEAAFLLGVLYSYTCTAMRHCSSAQMPRTSVANLVARTYRASARFFDVMSHRLTPNPAFGKEDRTLDGPEPARFMCPVTLQEMNGSHAFVVIMTTGWVMSEKATKEVGVAGLQVCNICKYVCMYVCIRPCRLCRLE